MQILFHETYVGWASNEQRIPAGQYAVGDARLMGNEDYFVNIVRVASYIGEDGVFLPIVEPEVRHTIVEPDFENLEHDGRTLRVFEPDTEIPAGFPLTSTDVETEVSEEPETVDDETAEGDDDEQPARRRRRSS